MSAQYSLTYCQSGSQTSARPLSLVCHHPTVGLLFSDNPNLCNRESKHCLNRHRLPDESNTISLIVYSLFGTSTHGSRSSWHLPVRAALHDERAVVRGNGLHEIPLGECCISDPMFLLPVGTRDDVPHMILLVKAPDNNTKQI